MGFSLQTDREWTKAIFAHYEWFDDKENRFLITDIPCVDFSFPNKEFFTQHVKIRFNQLIECQKRGTIPSIVSFEVDTTGLKQNMQHI